MASGDLRAERASEIIPLDMGKRAEALDLLRSGLDPVQIADRQGVTVQTILGYLDQMIGVGRLRRSDVLFSVSPEKRREAANRETVMEDSFSGPGLLARYAEILERYGSAAHALGDMYEDLRCVEVSLHARVREVLQAKFGNAQDGWWRKGVSETLRKKLVARREEDDSPEDPYAYTDLLDLAEILERNWGQIAADVVPNPAEKQAALADLRRLNQIRRKVMHPVRSSVPTEQEFEFVRNVRKRFRV